jgi:transcriptional regulator with XRE-family HTH domain
MKYRFGDKIREVREKRKMTLKDVARQVEVSESLISQIERNRVSPAMDTLLRIVDVLEMDIEYLFQEFKKTKSVHLVRRAERSKIVLPGVIYEQLSKTVNADEEHAMEAYCLEIAPGGEKGSREFGHRGGELGLILEGKGELRFGTETYELCAGDSISFAADIPHVLKNTGRKALKAVWVTTPPKIFFKQT